jgi:glyoxylase-like metal-dependent hydrolase (beta-lactamase superfamily II)/rhodanese-related sulfurtransferase
MKIEQIYTGCLAEAAYYLECDGEAAIIDPLREPEPYLERAQRDGATIKYVFETHFHADFVSGHLELARKTNATIVFGPSAQPAYPAHIASDGEVFSLGRCKIKTLHTPGHTLESTTYLLKDENGKDQAIFTGDTLFVGDVGRPDLVQKVKAEITPTYLAGLLYDSLRNQIMTLADDVVVYPGHGAGSACGKKMDKETVSTVGKQKQFNYALRAGLSRDQFIEEVLDGLSEPPQYFPGNVLLNVKGYAPVDEVRAKGATALRVPEFLATWEAAHALVIDTRPKEKFVKGFIPGSIFIGIDDSFAPWVGTLVPDLNQPILIVAEEGRENEVVTRLARVGYDHALGYLKGELTAWRAAGEQVATIDEISPGELAQKFSLLTPGALIDARRTSEYQTEHVVGATSFPLDFINRNMATLDPAKTYYIHCAGGYRSVIMASILKSRGYAHVVNVQGGYKALSATSLPRTDRVEVNTAL